MSGNWILWFEELGKEHNDRVGKKCANLGEMTRLGLRVPGGFALTLEAYEAFMEHSGAGEEIREYLLKAGEIDSIERFNEVSAELRKMVHSREIPTEMKEMVRKVPEGRCCGRNAFGRGEKSPGPV